MAAAGSRGDLPGAAAHPTPWECASNVAGGPVGMATSSEAAPEPHTPPQGMEPGTPMSMSLSVFKALKLMKLVRVSC